MTKEIDVHTMICAAIQCTAGSEERGYIAAKDAWEALPPAERERRAVQVRAAIAGESVPWGAIAERVARHAWDVASEGHAHPETWEEARDRWMGGAREWCDGHEALRTSHMSARLAARALAEALGYRLDGAPCCAFHASGGHADDRCGRDPVSIVYGAPVGAGAEDAPTDDDARLDAIRAADDDRRLTLARNLAKMIVAPSQVADCINALLAFKAAP